MAGKKRDGGSVKVKITDDGSLKNLGKNAKKAGKDVGSVAKNVQESDRRLKSLSQQTSNSTKAFSKQAQTIGGGLVPIYATIAAQVFAVSAAFRFLQDAMETRNMIEGQKSFGAITGQAFATMTASVQKATADMITFKEAASAVAIGSAAGLTRSQLEGLGTAAKNASLALGRDVTDAFNRLIRGVTKAEPELLDELGIILRLEPATEKYALSIGKARTELNAFERSQAVANEVLDQAERKFAAIARIMDPDAFALGQFAKEFDDLMKSVKVNVIEVVIPAVQFFKENILSLIGVLGLLAAPILSQILPDFGKMASKFSDTADASSAMAKSLKKDSKMIKKIKGGGDIGKQAQKEFTDRGRKGMQGMLSGMDMSDQSATLQKAAKGKKLNAKELGVLKRHLKQKNNIVGNMTKQDQVVFDRYIKHQELGLKGSLTKSKLEFKQLGITGSKTWASIKAGASATTAAVARFGATAVKWGGRILGAFGWVSIAFIAFDAIRGFFKDEEKEATRFQKAMEEVNDSMTTLNEELNRMERVRGMGLLTSSIELVVQQANALKTSDVVKIIQDYNKAVRGGASQDILDTFKLTAESLSRLAPEMAGFADLFDNQIIGTDASKPFIDISNGIMQIGMALGQMAEQLQNVDKAMTSLISGTPKSKFTALRKSIADITKKEGGAFGEDAFKKRRKENENMTSIMGGKGDYLTSMQGFGALVEGFKDMNGRKNLPKIDKVMNKILEIAATPDGINVLEQGTGEVFGSVAAVQNYIEKKNRGTRFDGDYMQEQMIPLINALSGENLEDPAAMAEFAKTISAIQTNQALDMADIENDESSTTILKKIEKDIVTNIKEESRIRTALSQIKLDQLDTALLTNKAEASSVAFTGDLLTSTQMVAKAKNDLAAAELVNNQAYADMQKLDKEALEIQQTIAEENLAIAQEELRVMKEKVGLQLKINDFNVTRTSDKLEYGSFGNSFFNKQRDFVLSNESDIRNQGTIAAADAAVRDEDGNITNPAEVEAAKAAAIDSATQAYADQYFQIEKVNSALKLQQGISTRLTEGLANDMAGALVEVAKGTKTMKEAFSQMAISILADITKMIIKQLILNALMAMVGMINPGAAAGLSALMGGTPVREGGIMSPGAGGGYRSYRSGGVADGPEAGYPATLHGTEAVVPLGNDKSIPVKMLEGSSGTNNVNVTVNMTEGGTDFKMEGEKAKAFGSSIAAAVQQEIVKQQRTGGLLSSY